MFILFVVSYLTSFPTLTLLHTIIYTFLDPTDPDPLPNCPDPYLSLWPISTPSASSCSSMAFLTTEKGSSWKMAFPDHLTSSIFLKSLSDDGLQSWSKMAFPDPHSYNAIQIPSPTLTFYLPWPPQQLHVPLGPSWPQTSAAPES